MSCWDSLCSESEFLSWVVPANSKSALLHLGTVHSEFMHWNAWHCFVLSALLNTFCPLSIDETSLLRSHSSGFVMCSDGVSWSCHSGFYHLMSKVFYSVLNVPQMSTLSPSSHTHEKLLSLQRFWHQCSHRIASPAEDKCACVQVIPKLSRSYNCLLRNLQKGARLSGRSLGSLPWSATQDLMICPHLFSPLLDLKPSGHQTQLFSTQWWPWGPSTHITILLVGMYSW